MIITRTHTLDLLLDTIALVVVDGCSPITIATTLRIALPMSKFNIPIGMYTSDDDEEFNNHVLKEDAGLELGYVEPYVAAKETLWLVPGIDNIVRGALKRMAKAFAYNSAYFLKVILDLQVTYLGLNPAPAPDTVLDRNLVLRIAEIMAGRMARRDRDNNSPSRELQLRTLVSALTLLYQIKIEKLEDYTYAKLLKDVSERDSDNQTKFEEGRRNCGRPGNGDVEFLVRYACDLIRCLPSDLPNFNGPNSQAMNVHFLFAAGFIVSHLVFELFFLSVNFSSTLRTNLMVKQLLRPLIKYSLELELLRQNGIKICVISMKVPLGRFHSIIRRFQKALHEYPSTLVIWQLKSPGQL